MYLRLCDNKKQSNLVSEQDWWIGTARMRSQNTEQYSMAITFNGCGSRVVLCTWAHDFAILDPHSLALLTICCSLYFCIQVDVWHTLEDYASQEDAASRAPQCSGTRRGSSPGMLDSPVGRRMYRVSSTWSCRIRAAWLRWILRRRFEYD